jgi:hypothetical protein
MPVPKPTLIRRITEEFIEAPEEVDELDEESDKDEDSDADEESDRPATPRRKR